MDDPEMEQFARQGRGIRGVLQTVEVLLLISAPAEAQTIGVSSQGPTFTHELTLIVIDAVLGGFLGPLLMIVDGWIGISPGARRQKQNYAAQRDIADSLRTLIALKTTNGNKPSQTLPPATGILIGLTIPLWAYLWITRRQKRPPG